MPGYETLSDQAALIEHNMATHTPTDAKTIADVESLQFYARDFAHAIARICPADNRERDLAMDNLEQSLMWAVACVTRFDAAGS